MRESMIVKGSSLAVVAALLVACSSSSSGGGFPEAGADGARPGTGTGKGGGLFGGGGGGGGDGGGGGQGGGGSCAASAEDDSCASCLKQSCCQETLACGNNADCVAIFNCAEACDSEQCINNCIATYPQGDAPLRTLLNCAQQRCAQGCGGGGTEG